MLIYLDLILWSNLLKESRVTDNINLAVIILDLRAGSWRQGCLMGHSTKLDMKQ